MNPAGDPLYVMAEVTYRFDTGHITQPPTVPARHRDHGLVPWLRRRGRPRPPQA